MAFQLASQPIPGLPDSVAVKVAGQLDLLLAPTFREQFEAALPPQVQYLLAILDDVEFIDSHNLGVFVAAYQRVKARGGWLGMICHSPQVGRVFEVTNLNRLFRVFDTWEEFRKSLVEAGILAPEVPFPAPTFGGRSAG
ncbi:MAG TPA: STAS domain-containing protein [Candidatus Xenobia bacterium]|jgi:anti-sigma B factor antagonist